MILISHDHLQHDDRYILSEALGLNIKCLKVYRFKNVPILLLVF